MDRREGQFEKAIQGFSSAIARDPRNSVFIEDLALTLAITHQFHAAEEMFDRLIELRPDQPILKVQKPLFVNYYKTGDDAAVRSAIAAIPTSMADDQGVLSLRLAFSLVDRDWPQARQLVGKLNGEDDGFAYGKVDVPVGCYSILLARLQGEQSDLDAKFAETREQLNQKFQAAPGNGRLLSLLAVVDALLKNKELAISEAKRAIELLPVSKDALYGRALEILTKVPNGIFYGQLKRDPEWGPLRQDPRYEKLLAELAPKD
jgi:tetratricopeptide (TPR) repeat protein